MSNMVNYIMMFCTDAAFCYICMKAEQEKYKASTKCEPGKTARRCCSLVETILQDVHILSRKGP